MELAPPLHAGRIGHFDDPPGTLVDGLALLPWRKILYQLTELALRFFAHSRLCL